ncbi:MAG: hypoxanthine phosphoribosyltransferase [Bacteroidales bacterium]|nr:hypoxanthine phosphoribosyltransferase [Bacteroidales bacterium]
MNTIQVNGKRFRQYIGEAEIQAIIARLGSQMSEDLRDKDPILCPVLTGSFIFAADLCRSLDFDPDIAFVRYTSYSGMQSTGVLKASLRFPDRCKGRHVVIVEDVVDTGISMDGMIKELQALEPASIRVCTLLFKPGSFTKDFKIDYIGKSIPDDFILGYGLDYDDMGRTYKDIYVLDK